MYVCMYVSVCIYICIYVYLYLFKIFCIDIFMYVYIHVFMYVVCCANLAGADPYHFQTLHARLPTPPIPGAGLVSAAISERSETD